MKVLPVSCSLISLLGVTAPTALAQPITPAQDGTGTIINRNGDRFDITGGSLGGDRSNLFHSFQQFNLDANQTANFISAPNIHNILGRVTGGNASIINGLIQVTGGNSNLYLINPAGVIFGPNARLDVPASFSVTTATGIGFGNNWFEAIGSNDYRNLVGTPNRYRFDVALPGAIVNSGKLELSPEQNLTLAGGTVINTGEISTPGGNVTIAAVEGGDTVRISQPGHLLNLEISNGGVGEREQITPLSLPSLLTEGNFSDRVTGIIVNENGEVVLTGSRDRVSGEGMAIASGTIDTSSSNIGGEVNVIGSRVGILNANINADGINGGGNVFVGGDFQGNNRLPASQQTVINNNSFISANAIENGDGGRVIIWSDGTTRFEGNISATGGEFAGNGGLVEVSGKEQLFVDGFIDVTAPNGESGTILFDPENIEIGLATDVVTDETDGLSGGENIEGLEEKDTETTAEETSEVEESANPFAPDEDFNVTISADNLEELEGNVTLQADNDITVNEGIETSGSVELKAGRSININADIDTSSGNGNIALFANNNSANIANRSSGAGNITQRDGTTLNAGSGNIRMRLGSLGEVGDINLANLTTSGRVNIDANGGNIGQVSANSLLAAGEVILQTSGRGGIGLSRLPLRVDVDNLEAVSGRGGAFFDALGGVTVGGVTNEFGGISTTGGGDVELSAERKVTVSEEISTAVRRGRSGNIEIESRSGGIDTTAARIDASSELGRGGDISLTAARNVRTADVDSSVGGEDYFKAGNITIESSGGAIDTTEGTVDASSFNAYGGKVEMEAAGDITTADITTAVGQVAFDKDGVPASSEGGDGRGGSIILNSSGVINTRAGTINSFSADGAGGDITFYGDGGILTGNINSFSYGISGFYSGGRYHYSRGGHISLEAGGVIDTTEGELNSRGYYNKAGNITLTGDDDVITGNINSSMLLENEHGNGGNIIIESGGVINTTDAVLDSRGFNRGGNITLMGDGDIQTGNIYSGSFPGYYINRGGNITVESSRGSVDTTEGLISSAASYGDGGKVEITADRNIQTGSILSRSINFYDGLGEHDDKGGNIILNARHGDIDTTGGNLESFSAYGHGGNVELIAPDGNIQTGNIYSENRGDEGYRRSGGHILLSAGGAINTAGGELRSGSVYGNGGDVTLEAGGDIFTGNINSSSSYYYNGGSIILRSSGGDVDTTAGVLNSSAVNGNGGAIEVEGDGNLFTGNINSSSSFYGNGGSIILRSLGGAIDTTGGTLNSSSAYGNGGNIFISAAGNITTANIDTQATERGGNIEITSESGAIDTSAGELNSRSTKNGTGGEITLQAEQEIATGDINSSVSKQEENNDTSSNTSDADVSSEEVLGNGGNVSMTATGSITTGNIDARATEQGGNIEITSESGAIDTSAGELNSGSTNGMGGNVTLTAEQTIITGNIDASGSLKGGEVVINSKASDVDTTDGELTTTSPEGTDGNIAIEANEGSIAVGEINGQNITVEDASADNASAESPEGDISTDADEINQQRGEVSLQADNDITINEAIASDSISNLELKAGRNININADIDTSGGNGNIILRANDDAANPEYRQSGTGNISMAAGTTLNAGEGDISLKLGNFAEVGNITLDNLRTTGTITVNANSGNILRAADNSLIRAGSAIFQTRGDRKSTRLNSSHT